MPAPTDKDLARLSHRVYKALYPAFVLRGRLQLRYGADHAIAGAFFKIFSLMQKDVEICIADPGKTGDPEWVKRGSEIGEATQEFRRTPAELFRDPMR